MAGLDVKDGDRVRVRDLPSLPPHLARLKGRTGIVVSAGTEVAKVKFDPVDPDFPPVRLVLLLEELERA